MKNKFNLKNAESLAAERKWSPFRLGSKTFTHRHERRKVRGQLRHLDSALAGEE